MKQLFQYDTTNKQNNALHLANLSRNQALFCIDIYNTLKLLLNENDNMQRKSLVLAVSGGIDSIAMFGIFLALQKKYARSLCVAHFNHSIREESDEEARFVAHMCSHFDISFYTKKEDIPRFAKENKLGLEEASRIRRYKFFEEIREKTQSDYICTAHHAHDLAEDMLMRLCRGAVWPNLAGMPLICDDRRIIRPLLYQEKQSFISFIEELKFPYVNDASNENQEFLRNRIRKQVLPFFLNENPNFLESIHNLHQCARDDMDFFDGYIDAFWHHVTIKTLSKNDKEVIGQKEPFFYLSNIQEVSIPLKVLHTVPRAMRFRIYVRILSFFKEAFSQNITLKLLDKAVMQNNGQRVFKFTKKIRATLQNARVVFYLSCRL